jgi:glucose-6-phosphate 1-epimerase
MRLDPRAAEPGASRSAQRRVRAAALSLALMGAASSSLAAAVVPPAAQAAAQPAATPAATPAAPAAPAAPAVDPAAQRAFEACLAGLRPAQRAAGLRDATLDAHLGGLVPDPSLLTLLNQQPEFTTPIWDYLAALVDQQRVDDGLAMLEQHRAVLDEVAARYGVDAETVVAVWGVESDFGRISGRRPILQSLATLSCEGRRQAFFRGELIATLQIVQDGDVDPAKLMGSWAGAFGHTQFMPSTYRRIAVDFDGDGRRDLIDSIPDALGSTAHYLQRSGWRTGQRWGMEVRLPDGFAPGQPDRRARRPISEWRARGLTLADGTPLPADAPDAGLLLPAGAGGPAFLVHRNFEAIYSYNAAVSYALAIAHLSDRLRGGGAFATPWPTDDPGIGRAERRELQTLLLARGHAIGEADGLIGTKTREAIVLEQRRLGLEPADGRAGQRILRALREGR